MREVTVNRHELDANPPHLTRLEMDFAPDLRDLCTASDDGSAAPRRGSPKEGRKPAKKRLARWRAPTDLLRDTLLRIGHRSDRRNG